MKCSEVFAYNFIITFYNSYIEVEDFIVSKSMLLEIKQTSANLYTANLEKVKINI